MDSLNDILGRKDLDEPSESVAIKRYVERNFQMSVSVSVQAESIVITAKSAGLTNTLRLQTLQLKEAAQTNKKLVFRIS